MRHGRSPIYKLALLCIYVWQNFFFNTNTGEVIFGRLVCTAAHTIAVECFIRNNSIIDTQQAFQHEFSNDCATGPSPTSKTLAWVNMWCQDRFGAGLKETRPMRTVHKPENVEGVRATFGEVHIVLSEDMHHH